MAHHHRENAGRIAHRAFSIVMQVGSADPNGVDAHLYFARRGVFGRHFGQPELTSGNEFGCFHENRGLMPQYTV